MVRTDFGFRPFTVSREFFRAPKGAPSGALARPTRSMPSPLQVRQAEKRAWADACELSSFWVCLFFLLVVLVYVGGWLVWFGLDWFGWIGLDWCGYFLGVLLVLIGLSLFGLVWSGLFGFVLDSVCVLICFGLVWLFCFFVWLV